jgi:hypothetical protein
MNALSRQQRHGNGDEPCHHADYGAEDGGVDAVTREFAHNGLSIF